MPTLEPEAFVTHHELASATEGIHRRIDTVVAGTLNRTNQTQHELEALRAHVAELEDLLTDLQSPPQS